VSQDAALSCTCGALRGTLTDVSSRTGNRFVCYCDDCQAFAHYLDRADILDVWGGSDIFQVASGQVRIDNGLEQLRCLRLSEKGMYRWYAGCCRTPVGNMMGASFPFIGVLRPFLAAAAPTGPPVGHILGKFAKGGCPPHASPRVPLRIVPRIVKNAGRWLLFHRHEPQVFFDRATKRPVAEPKVLTPAERAKVTPVSVRA
jgi:Family of unknown function (DUF6151)